MLEKHTSFCHTNSQKIQNSSSLYICEKYTSFCHMNSQKVQKNFSLYICESLVSTWNGYLNLPQMTITLTYVDESILFLVQYIWNQTTKQVFFLGGTGGPPIWQKFCQSPPPSDTCPRFWTKACPPQPRFVPENFKNLNTFLCQMWLLLSSKVP